MKPGEDLVWISRSGKSVSDDDRTGKPVETSRSDHLQEGYGRSSSSQEWKSGAAEHDRYGKPERNSWDSLQKKLTLIVRNLFSAGMRILQGTDGVPIHDRTGKLVSENLHEQAYFQNFVMGSDAEELVNKARDQVRNRQKRMSSIAESCTEPSRIWGMFMATTLNAATFMGNVSTIQSVVKNHESLTLKKMFDVTAQLVNNQEEINCLDKILWGKNSWTRLSLIHDAVVINLQSTKVYAFSDSVLCLGKKLGRTELQEPEPREATEILMLSVESRRNSSGTFSQDSQRCSSVIKSAIF